MTSLDMLKEKMIQAGALKNQCESKLVPMILGILAENPEYIELAKQDKDLQDEIASLKRYKKELEEEIAADEETLFKLQHEKTDEWKRLNEAARIANDYIVNFNIELLNAETPEQRDALRTAQFFINNVNIDTKYDNTAYISGLAAILSNGGVSTTMQLQKSDSSMDCLSKPNNTYADRRI